MQLHLKSFGSGEPVLILHGMLGMLDNWQNFGRILSRQHLVYLVDLRNHGNSGSEEEMGYQAMAEDVKETMEAQWLYEGAIVIGHSMGGKTAMQLALDHPDLVKALIVIDIAPVTYQGGHEKILAALNQVKLSSVDSRQAVFDELIDSIPNPRIVNFLMKNLSRKKDGSYQWKVNLRAITKNYNQLLGAPVYTNTPYEGPTLFVRGGQTQYISSDAEGRIGEWFPNNEIVTIQDAGHWVHADQPEQLGQIIETFIEKNV